MNLQLFKRMRALVICQDQESVCLAGTKSTFRQKEMGIRWENLDGNGVYRGLFSPTLARFAFLNFKGQPFLVRSGIEHGFRNIINTVHDEISTICILLLIEN